MVCGSALITLLSHMLWLELLTLLLLWLTGHLQNHEVRHEFDQFSAHNVERVMKLGGKIQFQHAKFHPHRLTQSEGIQNKSCSLQKNTLYRGGKRRKEERTANLNNRTNKPTLS